jgi:CubicO group peptidase (beta-lactamase class C family)
MHEIVERERVRAGVPGCAVVVVRNGEVLLCEGFGVRDVDGQLPVTAGTLFPIGSATKTFTAYLLATSGLDLDAPLGLAMQAPAAAALSLRDCLSHRSGLPRHDLVWQAGEGVITRDELVAALAHLAPSAPFRSEYQYNNLLYVAAGHLGARALGGSYEEALAARVLQPLGMRRTNLAVATTEADADHARPYVLPDGHLVKEIPFATLELAGPAGGINSCGEDLVPWLLAVTADSTLGTPLVPMPPREPLGPFEPLGYGLGLMVERHRGHVVTHHGGNIDGFSSQVLTRDDGTGVAVLTNLQTTWVRDSLPYLLLDHLDGVPSPDYGTLFAERLQRLLSQAEPELAPVATGPSPSVDVGAFHHPGYGGLLVDRRNDVLVWRLRGLREGTLVPLTDGTFAAKVWLYGAERHFPGAFEGGAWHLHLEPAVAPIRFARTARSQAS